MEDLFGSNFVDAGAGDGKLTACAIAAGAAKAMGYELPENDAHRVIFAALMSRLEQSMFPPWYSVGRLGEFSGNNRVLLRYYCICCSKFLPLPS